MAQGKRASTQTKNKFKELLDQGVPINQASRAVGMSERWGNTEAKNLQYEPVRKEDAEVPDPKQYDELDGGVKDLLGSFSLFREVCLCRDSVPWAEEAAEKTVESLLNKETKDYGVMNEPPGVGKTTAFTYDLPLWLICGGGFENPAIGRASRIMLGSEGKKVAVNYVRRLRNTLGSPRPYYDKDKQQRAEISLVEAFGRFRPLATRGDDVMWRADQFLVAQMVDLDVYEKEPTVQAASKESGFLGERVILAIWDDLVNKRNATNPDTAADLAEWFQDEAETRIEPGGMLILVGQRIGPNDLYANRKKATYLDHLGRAQPKYQQVIFPAHNEEQCPNEGTLGPTCFQWKGDEGCLLDAHRLSYRTLQQVASQGNYRTVYQQEDANPEDLLVQEAWIYGGKDASGFVAPGCLDKERGFWEWPEDSFVTYAMVKPDPEKNWATEIWVLANRGENRSLIYGETRRMRAGMERGFLDWDPFRKCHIGLMEELQTKSAEVGRPIRVWIIGAEIAKGYLFKSRVYRRWKARWPKVEVLPHSTDEDEDYSIDLALGTPYQLGAKRLPFAEHPETQNYVRLKIEELTKFPQHSSDDTVYCDWYGEQNIERVKRALDAMKKWDGRRKNQNALPPYLRNQNRYVRRFAGVRQAS